jgi:hypothetical protein
MILIGLAGLVSFGINGLLSSLGGLIDHNALVGLIGCIRLVGFVIHHLAPFINMAKTILCWLKHAVTHRVAKQSSATEITNAAIYYYCTFSLLHASSLVREKMCWWVPLTKKKMWLWIASFGDPYNGDVLQSAKQLFFLSLPQMTKYCVMRECENIHSWISLVGDLAFSRQDGIYGFKFPKRFSGDLFLRSHSFTLLLN